MTEAIDNIPPDTPFVTDQNKTPKPGVVKATPYRWIILLLFSAFSATNSYQWIQYAIIPEAMMDAYSIASTTNDWMSIIYMVVYIPLIIPATWALDRYGLRNVEN